MPHEIGGLSEKLGNRYEGRWVVKQLLRLLNEEIKSITVEPLGDKEQGIDLVVVKKGGVRQLQQCKSRYRSSNSWTPSILNASGILSYLKNALLREQEIEYALVSPLVSTKFLDLCDWARRSSGNAQDYYQNQVKKSSSMEDSFNSLCRGFELDPNVNSELNKVFSLLKRTYVITFPDDENEMTNLYRFAGFKLTGKSATAISVLLTYIEQDNYRKPIYANDLLTYLQEEHSIYSRNLSQDTRLIPAIEKLQSQFMSSLSHNLINGKLIHRKETSQIIENIEASKDVIIYGTGGGGKSTVLFELATHLQRERVPFLAISLDRIIPESTAKKFGESIGLMDSPVQCLLEYASDRKSVLILDQLDSIRWTSKHSTISMDVCKEMLSDVKGAREAGNQISIVFACRLFDLENDPDIQRMLHVGANDTFVKIGVQSLTSDMVREIVGSGYEQLTVKQKKVLSCSQNLKLWTSLEAAGLSTNFSSSVQLMRSYWKYITEKVLHYHNVPGEELFALLDCFLGYLDRKGRIFAPERIVEMFPEARGALFSLGVIKEEDGQIGFVHQQYYDYLIAQRQLKSIDNDPTSILEWLGEQSSQSLFRREHLHQILAFLADESSEDLLIVSRTILESKSIRFHLKHLVLEILGQLDEISDDISAYCCAFETDSYWKKHVLDTVFLGHPAWIKCIHKGNYFSQKLSSSDDDTIKGTLWLLRSVADALPDLVTSILLPYESMDDEWNKKILNTICLDPVNDSHAMFQLRLVLAQKGVLNEHVNWKKYCKKHPLRALMYLEQIVSTWRYDSDGDLHIGKEILIYDASEISNLKSVIEKYPNYSWHLLFAQTFRLAEAIEKKNDRKIAVWDNDGLSSEHNSNVQNLLSLVRYAGVLLARIHPNRFIEYLDSYASNPSIIISRLFLESAIELEIAYADKVIEWLLDHKPLFQIGSGITEPEWALAVRVLEKHSAYCSDRLFVELEKAIYYYHDPREAELARYYLKSWKDGWYEYFWGKCQYFLLPALDQSRTEENTKKLILELKRRCCKYNKDRFLTRHSLSGGRIGSTLEPNLDKISDRAWLQIVRNDEAINSSKRKWIPYGDGVVLESSISQFANSLRKMTYRFPDRFARLALQFPENIDSAYLSAVFDACKLNEPGEEHVPAHEIDFWEPVSITILEQLLEKYSTADDAVTAMSFVYLIDTRASEDWGESSIDRLVRYAIQHPDPVANELHVHCNLTADEASIGVLRTNSLNCVRGAAANALAKLLWEKKENFNRIQPAIESLIRDPHPAVRIASLRVIHATVNIDREKAMQWYFIACTGDLRIMASDMSLRIADIFINTHPERIHPLLTSLISSTDEEIQRIGAKRIASYWIVRGFYMPEVFENIHGATSVRKGFAQAGLYYLNNPEYLDKSIELLSKYINDPDVNVRDELHSMFVDSRNIYTTNDLYKQFLVSYIKSQTFLDDPAHFLFDLENYTGSILPFAEVITKMAQEIARKFQLEEEYIAGKDYQIRMITAILLRLYQESCTAENKSIQNRCLDCWDNYLESRIGRVAEITKLIDEN